MGRNRLGATARAIADRQPRQLDHAAREGEGCFAQTTPSESKQRLPEAGRDLWRLAEMLKATPAVDKNSCAALCRLLDEQFEVGDVSSAIRDDDQRVRVKKPKEIPCDNIRNPGRWTPSSAYGLAASKSAQMVIVVSSGAGILKAGGGRSVTAIAAAVADALRAASATAADRSLIATSPPYSSRILSSASGQAETCGHD